MGILPKVSDIGGTIVGNGLKDAFTTARESATVLENMRKTEAELIEKIVRLASLVGFKFTKVDEVGDSQKRAVSLELSFEEEKAKSEKLTAEKERIKKELEDLKLGNKDSGIIGSDQIEKEYADLLLELGKTKNLVEEAPEKINKLTKEIKSYNVGFQKNNEEDLKEKQKELEKIKSDLEEGKEKLPNLQAKCDITKTKWEHSLGLVRDKQVLFSEIETESNQAESLLEAKKKEIEDTKTKIGKLREDFRKHAGLVGLGAGALSNAINSYDPFDILLTKVKLWKVYANELAQDNVGEIFRKKPVYKKNEDGKISIAADTGYKEKEESWMEFYDKRTDSRLSTNDLGIPVDNYGNEVDRKNLKYKPQGPGSYYFDEKGNKHSCYVDNDGVEISFDAEGFLTGSPIWMKSNGVKVTEGDIRDNKALRETMALSNLYLGSTPDGVYAYAKELDDLYVSQTTVSEVEGVMGDLGNIRLASTAVGYYQNLSQSANAIGSSMLSSFGIMKEMDDLARFAELFEAMSQNSGNQQRILNADEERLIQKYEGAYNAWKDKQRSFLATTPRSGWGDIYGVGITNALTENVGSVYQFITQQRLAGVFEGMAIWGDHILDNWDTGHLSIMTTDKNNKDTTVLVKIRDYFEDRYGITDKSELTKKMLLNYCIESSGQHHFGQKNMREAGGISGEIEALADMMLRMGCDMHSPQVARLKLDSKTPKGNGQIRKKFEFGTYHAATGAIQIVCQNVKGSTPVSIAEKFGNLLSFRGGLWPEQFFNLIGVKYNNVSTEPEDPKHQIIVNPNTGKPPKEKYERKTMHGFKVKNIEEALQKKLIKTVSGGMAEISTDIVPTGKGMWGVNLPKSFIPNSFMPNNLLRPKGSVFGGNSQALKTNIREAYISKNGKFSFWTLAKTALSATILPNHMAGKYAGAVLGYRGVGRAVGLALDIAKYAYAGYAVSQGSNLHDAMEMATGSYVPGVQDIIPNVVDLNHYATELLSKIPNVLSDAWHNALNIFTESKSIETGKILEAVNGKLSEIPIDAKVQILTEAKEIAVGVQDTFSVNSKLLVSAAEGVTNVNLSEGSIVFGDGSNIYHILTPGTSIEVANETVKAVSEIIRVGADPHIIKLGTAQIYDSSISENIANFVSSNIGSENIRSATSKTLEIAKDSGNVIYFSITDIKGEAHNLILSAQEGAKIVFDKIQNITDLGRIGDVAESVRTVALDAKDKITIGEKSITAQELLNQVQNISNKIYNQR